MILPYHWHYPNNVPNLKKARKQGDKSLPQWSPDQLKKIRNAENVTTAIELNGVPMAR